MWEVASMNGVEFFISDVHRSTYVVVSSVILREGKVMNGGGSLCVVYKCSLYTCASPTITNAVSSANDFTSALEILRFQEQRANRVGYEWVVMPGFTCSEHFGCEVWYVHHTICHRNIDFRLRYLDASHRRISLASEGNRSTRPGRVFADQKS